MYSPSMECQRRHSSATSPCSPCGCTPTSAARAPALGSSGKPARLAWAAVGKMLKAAELDFSDIVEYTTYHVGLQATLPDFMTARDEALEAPWPAWTAIGVSELAVPGARLEIRVTARLRS